MFISERSRKRRPPWWLVAVGAALLLAVVTYLVISARTGDVRRGTKVEFTPLAPKPVAPSGTDWPFYHYDLAHRAYLPAKLRPPYRRTWLYGGNVLMEFPPIIADGRLFFIRNNGSLYALDADSGKVEWKRRVGRCAASSPAYADGIVYTTVLAADANCSSRGGTGRVEAVRATTGKRVWRRLLASRTESSPIVNDGMLYLGSESGTLYALRTRDGTVKWTHEVGGAIKASPALEGGTLYFGDYSGRMNAVWAKSGNGRWSASTSGAKLGFSSGQFYSTPAVAFGRVYAGNTDSKIYSFGAKGGDLAWSKSTGGYVYSSPAAASFPKLGPTVYIGSYDGTLYALDARTGSTRWTAQGGGRISGGVSVIGHVAYFADLDSKSTHGVDARTGKRVFSFPRGAYNPVVSDGQRIYLTGYGSVTALEPRGARP
ncbi:MAG: PQQ-binding-like beta-propeller repeat protein [Solirubrobacterales bacterium]